LRIALDSNVFIYALSRHPEWSGPAFQLLASIERGKATGVASVLCLMEVIVQPQSISVEQGDNAQLFMEGLHGIDYFSVDAEVAIRASRLRAGFGPKLRTPDALHLSTALVEQADIFVTNDRDLLGLGVAGLKIVSLSDAALTA
jgi:predicted nucleic acid-binding protein